MPDPYERDLRLRPSHGVTWRVQTKDRVAWFRTQAAAELARSGAEALSYGRIYADRAGPSGWLYGMVYEREPYEKDGTQRPHGLVLVEPTRGESTVARVTDLDGSLSAATITRETSARRAFESAADPPVDVVGLSIALREGAVRIVAEDGRYVLSVDEGVPFTVRTPTR